MSLTEAFCTFRILPRIGSSAWNSLLRASFAVPSAESPSTMNSSDWATSDERQSTSFAGSDEDSSAFLRRWVSLCVRAEMRAFISATTLSSSSAVWFLSSRLGEANRAVELARDDVGDDLAHRRRAEDLFGLPLELRLGHAHREHRASCPARMSSFSSLSLPTLRRRAFCSTWVRSTFISPCSKPCWCVPPLGVAMMLTNERVTVS